MSPSLDSVKDFTAKMIFAAMQKCNCLDDEGLSVDFDEMPPVQTWPVFFRVPFYMDTLVVEGQVYWHEKLGYTGIVILVDWMEDIAAGYHYNGHLLYPLEESGDYNC